MNAVIRAAGPGDLPRVEALLAASALPTVEVARWLDRFVVAEREAEGGKAGADPSARLAGVAGLEVHGSDGVLRSVAVAEWARGQGLGARLTAAVVERARTEGLGRLYLLTTTADHYFPRHGFRRIDRSEAPPAVAASVEFAEACPASAVAMVLELE